MSIIQPEFSDVNQYFSQNKNLRTQIREYIDKANMNTYKNLQDGELQLSQQKVNITEKQVQIQNDNVQLKLSRISSNKHRLIQQLHNLYEQQNKIRKKHLTRKNNHSIHKKITQNSNNLSSQKSVKQILKSQQNYEKSLQKKLINLYKKIQQKQQQLVNEAKTRKVQARQRRVNEIKATKEKQRYKKQNYAKSLSKGKLKNKQQYIYVKNQYNDQNLQKQRNKYLTMILHEKRKRMHTDFKQIRQHSIDHDAAISIKKQEFMQQLNENMQKHKKYANFPKSRFSRVILEQDRFKKIEQQNQRKYKKEIMNRLQKFKNYVSTNFKPKISQKSKFTPQKAITPKISPTKEQSKTKGNQYLFFSKQKAKKQDQKTSRQLEKIQQKIIIKSKNHLSKKYPNYLTINKHHKKNSERNLSMNNGQLTTSQVQQALIQIKKKQDAMKSTSNTKSQYSIAKDKIVLLKSMLQMRQ